MAMLMQHAQLANNVHGSLHVLSIDWVLQSWGLGLGPPLGLQTMQRAWAAMASDGMPCRPASWLGPLLLAACTVGVALCLVQLAQGRAAALPLSPSQLRSCWMSCGLQARQERTLHACKLRW